MTVNGVRGWPNGWASRGFLHELRCDNSPCYCERVLRVNGRSSRLRVAGSKTAPSIKDSAAEELP